MNNAFEIELTFIHLPGLAAFQITCLASKFRKVNGHTGQLTCSKLLVHVPFVFVRPHVNQPLARYST
jgi:hypothetical protein